MRLRLAAMLAAAVALSACTATSVTIRREGAVRMENVPAIPAELAERLVQYQNTRSASVSDWLPDGKGLLIATRFGDTTQLHTIASPGAARRQITFSREPIGSGQQLPDGTILFTRDTGGDENDQIYRYDPKTAKSTLLTDGKSRHSGPTLTRDKSAFAFSSNARNGRDTDVYIMEIAGGSPRMVLEGRGAWSAAHFDNAATKLLVSNYISIAESMAYILDLSSGERTPIVVVPQGEEVAVSDARFSRTGDGSIWFTTDWQSEFSRLALRRPDGTVTTVTADIDWDVQSIAQSDDGRTLAFTVNAGGFGELYLLDTATMQRRKAPLRGFYGGLDFHPDGSRIALSFSSAATVGDVYTMDVATMAMTRWTESEMGGLDPATFAEPTLAEFPSFDGRTITALYYRPKGDGPFPAIVNFHGGPEGQARPNFNPFYQFYLAEMGIAVLDANVRGSTGFGKTFASLDNGMLREDSVKDGGALLDWIARQPELDANRVAVQGGSYGGYMTLAMLTTYPDRIRAGIDSVGISSFASFLKNTSAYRQDLRRAEYGDERDPEMLAFFERISPLNNADRIASALFVAQGLNDPRVPWTEAEQIVRAARRNGAPVWYFLADDEGHGFAKKKNRDLFQQASVLFYREFLLN